MSDSLYIVICLIGVFISAVLLVREKAFRSKDICINAYIKLLISTCVFCLNDALWGCANQGYFNFNWIHVVIFSYIFHFCASLFSLNWFRYTVLYIYSQKNKKRFLLFLPFCLQIIMILSNFQYNTIFSVDKNGCYYGGSLRNYLFFLQFAYFVFALFRAVHLLIVEKDKYKRKRYIVVAITSIVPIFFGILLVIFPLVPFYTVGYMFSVFIIYVFNSTSDHAKHLLQVTEESNLKKISDYEIQLSEALANQNAIYFEMLKLQTNGIVGVDMDDNVLFINDAAAKMFGFKDALHFKGNALTLYEKSESAGKVRLLEDIQKMKETGGELSFEMTVSDSDNKKLHLLADILVVTLSNGRKIGISNYTDITPYKRMEKELLYLSETDELTKLCNRRSGEQKTELLLLNGKIGMFCIIDVDRFKSINDSYGHSVGDKVLIAIADSMRAAFRDRDIIMRLGGDEFSVFAVGIKTEEDVIRCIDRFFSEITKINIPELSKRKITVSAGVVLCSANSGLIFNDYYKAADFALYKSKKTPGNRLEFYKFGEFD